MWRTTLHSIAARKRRLLATSSAVLLGVAFLAGTLALIDTMTRGFSDQFGAANVGIDAVVRSSVEVGREDQTERGLIDRSLAEQIAEIAGVAAVAPRIEGTGRIIGADGDPVGGNGAPTVAGNWIDDGTLNAFDLAEGRAPAAPGEAVIDKRAADEGDLAVGDTTTVLTPDPVDVTIVGLATFGPADSQGAATYAAFTTDFADQVLMPESGLASDIVVSAENGVSQAELVDRLDAALAAGVESITGEELTAEMVEQTYEISVDFIGVVLALFAIVALVVATFSIYNTFSILVAQRTRELALLRALGASRGQVLRSVIAEALAVGLLASIGGIAVGLGVASGLLSLMHAFGRSTPGSSPALSTSTVLVALAVGVIVTLLATLEPAVRASRVPPLAALRDAAVDRSATSRKRAVVGVVLAVTGIVLVVAGASSEAVMVTGLGSLATLAGVVVVGPVAALPAAAVLAAPAARRGVSGALARRNAMRNPKRTAGTAIPLMIGVAVVSLFAVVASSLTRSIADAVDHQLAGDLVIVGEGEGGLSSDLAPTVAELPEVDAVTTVGIARVRIDGENTVVTTFDPTTIQAVIDVGIREGSLRDVGLDQVAVSVDYADERGLALGDPMTVGYPDGATGRYTVGAIYGNDDLVGGGGILLHHDAVSPHTTRPVDVNMLIALADGVADDEGAVAVQQVADRFSAPDVQISEEFTQSIAGEINELLTIVYALLVMAILIAVMAIANTLSLSIHERTRELGLLRAVGQSRRQVQAMVRSEAVTVALFGTIGGLGMGIFFGWGVVQALASEGFTSFAVPTVSLAVVLALGTLAGVVAAISPAHRAAQLDVLEAIATE